jgi:predicted metal-dependent hydrolase
VLHSGLMQVEAALFFETPEQIYARVFRSIKPRTPLPSIHIEFKKYANADSRISLSDGKLKVQISDMLQSAPAPVQEALAHILITKLYRRESDTRVLAVYRRYLNRADVRRTLHLVKRQRGRKQYRDAKGIVYDLHKMFDDMNVEFFGGLMAEPQLGWSVRPSRTTLGHYDPSHHAIILSALLDDPDCPELAVRYVMYHEMLHLRHPAVHRRARRCVHTAEFKEEERRFPEFQVAKTALKAFVERKRYAGHFLPNTKG